MMLNLHQKKILKVLRKYAENLKYGEPTKYDVIVTKNGEGRDTEYETIVNPPEDLNSEVKEALSKVTIDIQNVYNDSNVIENN